MDSTNEPIAGPSESRCSSPHVFVSDVGKCPTCGADAMDRSEFWEAAPDNGRELENMIARIKKAVENYYLALDRRQHGGVAQDTAFKRIEAVLNMTWKQGQMTAFIEKHQMLRKFYD